LVGFDDPAGQDRTIWLEALPEDLKAEVIDPADHSQVREGEANIRGRAPVQWQR